MEVIKMVSNIEFGICLKLLIDAVDISGSKLARIINVDSSLVNKWINGNRVPPYNTFYIDSISDYISKNIINSYQNKRINEILEMFVLESKIDEKADITYKIKSALLEAQGYSLEKRKTRKVKNKKTVFNNENINSLTGICDCIPLTSDDFIIFGTENIFNAAFELLNKALAVKPESEPILITNNNRLSYKLLFNSFYNNWETLMIKVLKHEWTVLSLYNLDDNFERSKNLISEIFSLIIHGKYMPFCTYKSNPMPLEFEFLIVPNVGAIVFLYSKSSPALDYAFYLSSKKAINALTNSFYDLKSNYFDMITYYKAKDIISLQKIISSFEEIPGNTYAFTNGIDLYYQNALAQYSHLTTHKLVPSQPISFEALHKKQFEYSIFNLKYYKCKLILLKNSIENIFLKEINTEYAVEYLKYIINIYESTNNFDIALVNETFLKKYSTILSSTAYFNLKENDSLIIIINESEKVKQNNFSLKAMSFTEPNLVYPIQKHFINIWDSIPTINKNKKRNTILVEEYA